MANNNSKKPEEKKSGQAKVSPEEKTASETKSDKVDSKILEQMAKAQGEIMAKLEALEKEREQDKKEKEALKEEIKKIKSKPAGLDSHDEDIVDDYLDIPVVFFNHSFEFSLPSYVLRGRTYLAPHKKLRFKLLHRYKLGDGSQAKVHAVCAYKCQSRKELEYLRNFPGYGYMIHEKLDSTKNVDTMYAEILTKEAARINAMDDRSMINACQNDGIPVGTDLALMRKQLITKRANTVKANYDNMFKKDGEKAIKMADNFKRIAEGREIENFDKIVNLDEAPLANRGIV